MQLQFEKTKGVDLKLKYLDKLLIQEGYFVKAIETHAYTYKFFLLTLSWAVLALSGCGGGASSGPSGAPGNSSILKALDTSISTSTPAKLPEGSESISLSRFWEKQVLNGFSRTGNLRGYAYEDFRNLEIKATAVSNTTDGKSTVLLIQHPDHHAQSGDSVTLTGVPRDLLDIPYSILNNKFEITGRDANAYFITVPFATGKRGTFTLTANFYYKYKECDGVQTVVQTPALPTVPATFFDAFEARVAKHTVENSVSGCSPPERNFTTFKYFAVRNPKYGATLNYPFIGQRVDGGDFASLDKTFDLPGSAAQPGQSGYIGTMKIYKSSNKLDLVGTSLLSYQILSHTTSTVFIVVKTSTTDDNNNLISTMTEVFGRNPTTDEDYKLIRTTVKYNNRRRNEVVIE